MPVKVEGPFKLGSGKGKIDFPFSKIYIPFFLFYENP